MFDLIVIGSGPIGIAMAREAAHNNLKVALIDKGPLLGAMYRYPTHMTFFSTSENISICGIPFPCKDARPSRFDALEYYRLVATHPNIEWFLYNEVTDIQGCKGDFTIQTKKKSLKAKVVVVATGFFDHSQNLQVPGEDQPHVTHFFTDGHAYAGLKTLIIGGANSAVIAALECWRHGADVTLVHRRNNFRDDIKYWLRPDIENRIKEGSIKVHWNTEVSEIKENEVVLKSNQEMIKLEIDNIIALTGYRSNFKWLLDNDIELNELHQPLLNVNSFESVSRQGVYLAGCVLCGDITNDLFIENGRDHVQSIIKEIV